MFKIPLFVFATLSIVRSETIDDSSTCGLYLAISSSATVEDNKWGLYAGKNYDSGVSVGYPEIAVNLINFQSNSRMDDSVEGDKTPDSSSLLYKTVDFFEQLVWVPTPGGAKFEIEEGRMITAIPGAGILGGYDQKLTNVDWNHTAAYLRSLNDNSDDSLLSHPGRGASSSFYDVQLRSKKFISAGTEIFMDFGGNWEEENEKDNLDEQDFVKLDETIKKMQSFFAKYQGDLDRRGKQEIYDFLLKDVMKAAVGAEKMKKVKDILPSDPDLLEQVLKNGGSLQYSQPKSFRELSWLEEHGRCMDNIKPGKSTIQNAGRGAFATRPISKGGLVAPVPLAQILDSSVLDMHELGMSPRFDKSRSDDGIDGFSKDNNGFHTLTDEKTGKQLLLNYCYGHPESSLLFYPSGAIASMINHSNEPNAKMVWSNHQGHEKHWLQTPAEQFLTEDNSFIGLVMEIVATRDIAQDEEIFIDYGTEWNNAWEEHQKEWNQKVSTGVLPSEWPLRAMDLNKVYKSKTYKTEAELTQEATEEPVYPDNVMLKCFAEIYEDDKNNDNKPPKVDEVDDGYAVKNWKLKDKKYVFDGDDLYDCTIVGREKLNIDDAKTNEKYNDPALIHSAMPYKYTVRRTSYDEESDGEEVIIVRDVPHYAFMFVDRPTTSDQFNPHSFRHYIGIPDEIFPKGPWRNVN